MQRFEALREKLAAHGVKDIVALSKDTPEQVAAHHARDKLTLTLLSDQDLSVIRQYGVEHHRAVEVSGPRLKLFGAHVGMVVKVKTMAIPTTLLVDEEGIVRWIDQAEDYRLRSDDERVLAAVTGVFG